MNKLNYGNFDSTSADIAFSSANGYNDPASELETRKQLSYPLKEVKDYINNTTPTDAGDNPVQLVVTSNSIGYRTTVGGTVNPITTMSSHSHGNITNAGDITVNATIASGDRLIINDESASKLVNSSITFGSSTTSYLANNGTWQTPSFTSKLVGINTSNVIATNVGRLADYTATQDCYFFVHNNTNQTCYIKINGVDVTIYNTFGSCSIPLKSGQVVYVSQSANVTTKVFGVATS